MTNYMLVHPGDKLELIFLTLLEALSIMLHVGLLVFNLCEPRLTMVAKSNTVVIYLA